MSDTITLARPYAKAAFEYAEAQHALAEWLQFFNSMALAVSDPLLLNFIHAPRVTKQQIFEVLLEVSQHPLSASMQNFLHLIVVNQRLELLPQMLIIYKILLADRERTINVDVLSAFPLSEQLQEKLRDSLQKRLQRSVFLHCESDKNLLGGAVIRAGDLVIDGSIRTKLQRLRDALVA